MWAKIVLNLLSNALKFTFAGGITVRLRERDGRGRARRSTTPASASTPAEQARLFERFHRVAARRSRSHEGSGIGLALVAELAALHGGGVAVQQRARRGQHVHRRDPARRRAPAGRRGHPADARLGDARVDRTGARVPAPRRCAGCVAAAGRRRAGEPRRRGRPAARSWSSTTTPTCATTSPGCSAPTTRVETAPTARRLSSWPVADPPDLVLTDVMMPRLDGFGLLAALRARPRDRRPSPWSCCRPGRARRRPSRASKPAPTTTWSSRSPRASCWPGCSANLELDRVRRSRATLERSQALLDQAQRLAQVGSWEIDARDRRAARPRRVRPPAADDAGGAARQGGLEASSPSACTPTTATRVRRRAGRGGRTGEPLDLELRLRRGPTASCAPSACVGELERDERRAAACVCAAATRTSPTSARPSRRSRRRPRAARGGRPRARDRRRAAAQPAARSTRSTPSSCEIADLLPGRRRGHQVGGDWYDVIELGAGRTGAGHGRRHGPRRAGRCGDGPAALGGARLRAARPAARRRPRAPRRRRPRPRRRPDRHLHLRGLRPLRPDARPTPTPATCRRCCAAPTASPAAARRRRAAAGHRPVHADRASASRSTAGATCSPSTPTAWSSTATATSTTGIDAPRARGSRAVDGPLDATRRTRSSTRCCADGPRRRRRRAARPRPPTRRRPPRSACARPRRAWRRARDARDVVAEALRTWALDRRPGRGRRAAGQRARDQRVIHGRPPVEVRLRRGERHRRARGARRRADGAAPAAPGARRRARPRPAARVACSPSAGAPGRLPDGKSVWWPTFSRYGETSDTRVLRSG